MVQGITDKDRNWVEDYSHENGNYQNKCCLCDNLFIGHKRRVTCKLCDNGIEGYYTVDEIFENVKYGKSIWGNKLFITDMTK